MYTKNEVIKRLKRKENFYVLDVTKNSFEKILGSKVEYATHERIEGEISSIYTVRNKEIQAVLNTRENHMNVEKITNKQIHLYTINMFGECQTVKLDIERMVFTTDADFVQNKIDKEKKEFDELLKRI